ncbi:MAG: hypothetical protein FWE90_00090 [Defluviitaleaceae bacterium]|nr:hypothetical protein [Defluviitaleaceae bacterium]
MADYIDTMNGLPPWLRDGGMAGCDARSRNRVKIHSVGQVLVSVLGSSPTPST